MQRALKGALNTQEEPDQLYEIGLLWLALFSRLRQKLVRLANKKNPNHPNLQCMLVSEELWHGIVSCELHKKKWLPVVVEEHKFSVWKLIITPCNTARPGELFYSIYINIQILVFFNSISLFPCKTLTGSYHSQVRTLSFVFYRTFKPKIMLCFCIPMMQQSINIHI